MSEENESLENQFFKLLEGAANPAASQFDYQQNIAEWLYDHEQMMIDVICQNEPKEKMTLKAMKPCMYNHSICASTSDEESLNAQKLLFPKKNVYTVKLSSRSLLNLTYGKLNGCTGILFNPANQNIWISAGVAADIAYSHSNLPNLKIMSMQEKKTQTSIEHEEKKDELLEQLIMKVNDCSSQKEQDGLDTRIIEELRTDSLIVPFSSEEGNSSSAASCIVDPYTGKMYLMAFTSMKELQKYTGKQPEGVMFTTFEWYAQQLLSNRKISGIVINSPEEGYSLSRLNFAIIKAEEAVDSRHADAVEAQAHFERYYRVMYKIGIFG